MPSATLLSGFAPLRSAWSALRLSLAVGITGVAALEHKMTWSLRALTLLDSKTTNGEQASLWAEHETWDRVGAGLAVGTI